MYQQVTYNIKLMIKYIKIQRRRRNTIWPRDWSSDVCSSDLDLPVKRAFSAVSCVATNIYGGTNESAVPGRRVLNLSWKQKNTRSEERRVGKECKNKTSSMSCKK